MICYPPTGYIMLGLKSLKFYGDHGAGYEGRGWFKWKRVTKYPNLG